MQPIVDNKDTDLLSSEIPTIHSLQTNQAHSTTGQDTREQNKAANYSTDIQVAKEVSPKEQKAKSGKDDDQRFEVLSKRLSYWIDIIRAVMMITVISCHYHQPDSQDYSTYFELLFPHFLTSNGWGIVMSFFFLAGFFTMLTFDKMQKKFLTDTKKFIKQFVLQQFKRYFQMHAVLFVWGLGMGAFYCWILGERGDIRHYLGPLAENYWIDFYLPLYWPGRVWRNISRICGATWYNNSLAQIESLFYIALFLTYFIRKKLNDFKYALVFTIGMLVILVLMQIIWDPEHHVDMFYYWAGAAIYWGRVGLVQTQRGRRIIDWIYTPKKKNIFIVWALSLGLIYAWLVMNRFKYEAHVIFLAILVLFDFFPFGKLPTMLDDFVKELKRLQMEIYLSHQAYIFDGHPRYYPEIVPRDLSVLRPTYIHFFVSWLMTIQIIVFSYPVHFISKPFESIPQWIYDVYTKKERKSDFKKNYWISVVGIGIGFILIILNQANAYGY